jgi:hypothetical protein
MAPGCQTTAEIVTEIEGLNINDSDVEVGLVWSNDPNNP